MAITAKEIRDLISAVPASSKSTICKDCGGSLSGDAIICDECDAKNALNLLRRLAAIDSSYAAALAEAESRTN